MSLSMEEGPLQEAAILTRAVENVFRKLIRLLIGRMTLTKLQEMIRIIFVEETVQSLKKDRPEKKVPLTRMALLTGLDTRTLNKLIEERQSSPALHREKKFLREITPECSVLDYWSTNSKFMNKNDGSPLVLNLRGNEPSFESLVRETLTARGVTVRSLLERLKSSNSVAIDEAAQTVRLLDSRYWPFEMEGATGAIELGLASVGNLVETVVHNVESKSNPSDLFFQRSNWTNRLNKRDILKLRDQARKYLSSAETDTIGILGNLEEDDISENQITAGISMFCFEDEASV